METKKTVAAAMLKGFSAVLSACSKPTEKPKVTLNTVSVLEQMCSEKDRNFILNEKILHDIEKCNYYPTFFGINDDGITVENKMYYITGLYGRDLLQKAESQTLALCESLGLDENLKKAFGRAYKEKGLYLEGLAMSTTNPESIRLYLTELGDRINVNCL